MKTGKRMMARREQMQRTEDYNERRIPPFFSTYDDHFVTSQFECLSSSHVVNKIPLLVFKEERARDSLTCQRRLNVAHKCLHKGSSCSSKLRRC